MSTYSASISFKFSSNIAKIGKAMASSFKKITDASKKMSTAIKNNMDGFKKLGGILKNAALVGIAAVTGAFAVALVKINAFDKSIKGLSAITGLAGNDLANFGDEALKTSSKFGIGASAYLDAVKLIASAKPELLKQPKLLKDITDQAVILSKASGGDLSLTEAANSLTTAMNQFDLSASDAGRAINVLAAGSKLGASEIKDTSKALASAGAAANMAGVSFEQTNAAIQVLAQKQIKGAEAGTALRNILLKTNKMMKEQGITDFNVALDGLGRAMENGADLSEKFGVENLTALDALLKGRDQYKQLTKDLTGTNIAQEQAAIAMKGFGERIDRAKESVYNALIVAFRPLAEILGKAAVVAADFISEMLKYPKTLTAIAIAAGAVSAALGAASAAISISIFLLSGAAAAFTAAASAAWAFAIALLANPITWVVLAVVALIAAITILAIKFKAVRDLLFVISMTGGLGPLIFATKLLIAYWDELSEYVKGFVDGALSEMKPIVDELAEAWHTVSEPVMMLVDTIIMMFDNLFPRAKSTKDELEKFGRIGRSVGQLVGAALKTILLPLRVILHLFNGLAELGETIGSVFTDGLSTAIDKLDKIASRVKTIKSAITDPFGTDEEIARQKELEEKIKAARERSLKRNAAETGATTLDAAKGAAIEVASEGTKAKLDVNMKINSEGRATVEKVKSTSKLNFTANIGMLAPGAI
jgi:TP901 family phage tail tape measure protein